MTGASAPSPNAVTASAYDTVNDNKSWYAFDSIRSRKWGLYDASNVNSNELPQTLTYDFGSGNGCALNKYRILGDDNPNRMPNTWSIHGSNDDSDYTLLDTQTGITWPSDYSWKTYTFSNTTSYRYLRFTYTSNNGDSNYAQLMELQYYDTARTGNFLALCTSNLPAPEIALPGEHFNTVLWTGNATARSITGVGFQPDMWWCKNRESSSENHRLQDVVRGATNQIYPNATSSQDTGVAQDLLSFDSDGFSIGTDNGCNESGNEIVAWNWKAGGSGVANEEGSISSTVSANTTAGLSICKYVGTSSATTYGHGLSKAPELVINKNLTSSDAWPVYGEDLTSAVYVIELNSDAAEYSDSDIWNSLAPSSTVVNIGNNAKINYTGRDYISYCFHSVEGYSKVGVYEGNGNADGPFIYTGFKPAMLIFKNTSTNGTSWDILDNKRDTYNAVSAWLLVNTTAAEGDDAMVDFLSNGFKLRITADEANKSGDTLIYIAFAESPFKYSNAR